MKNIIKSLFFVGATTILTANPAIMGGFTYKFGGNNSMENAGATLKILSTAEDKKPVIAAGVSFFPWAKDGKKYGLDVGAGYNVKNATIMGGWDFLQNQPSLSLGYSKGVSSSSDDDLKVIDDKTQTSCTESSN
jgi:hypothetical protein